MMQPTALKSAQWMPYSKDQGRWPFYVTTKLDFEKKTFFREQGGGVILTFADKVKLTTFLSSKLHLKISFQFWLVLKDGS